MLKFECGAAIKSRTNTRMRSESNAELECWGPILTMRADQPASEWQISGHSARVLWLAERELESE